MQEPTESMLSLLTTKHAKVALEILDAFGAVIWEMNKKQVGNSANRGGAGAHIQSLKHENTGVHCPLPDCRW
jgi:hypothetical protein